MESSSFHISAGSSEDRPVHFHESGTDDSYLDDVFDRIVASIQCGQPLDLEAIVAERTDLADQIRQQVRLAESTAPRPRADLPAIDGYTILGEAGRGGMGTVYLARQERLGGRAVALKVLSGSSAFSPGARRRFRQESDVVARLRHPNIVTVHDLADDSGPPAFAMEWVEGQSLAAIINHIRQADAALRAPAPAAPPAASSSSMPLSDDSRNADGCTSRAGPVIHIAQLRSFIACGADEDVRGQALDAETYTVFVCRVGIAIARALAAVHKEGLLHRDVKPSNILIRRDGTPLLTDFGLARDIERDATQVTQAGQFLGTPAYAAPEQLRGEDKALDPRTDVYSLGVTLYHALALRVPFDGQSSAAILRQIESARCRPLRSIDKSVPRDLATIVAKAMETEPTRRYESADELAEDVERLLSLRPIRARRAGIVDRVRKAARRNRAGLIGASAGAVATLLLTLAAIAYIVIAPRRAADHVRTAQTWLLDPDILDQFAGTLVTRHESAQDSELRSEPNALARAIAEYDIALRQTPWRNDIRLERAAVLAARDLRSRGQVTTAVEIPSILAQRAPGAAAYIAHRSGGPALDPSALDEVSPEDLRATGLIAFLVGDFEYAFLVWERLAARVEPDALVQGALGDVHAARREWPAMYVRMHRAVEAFPESDLLRLSLADAALHVDLIADAERLLNEVGLNPRGQTFDIRRRVLAGLHARRGEDAQAIEQFEFFRNCKMHPAAREEYGRFLMSRGRFRDAAVVFQELCALVPARASFRRLFLEACRSWLAAADDAEKNRARAGTLEGMHRSDCIMALFDAICREEFSLPTAKPPLERAESRSDTDGTLRQPDPWLNLRVDGLCEQVR